MKLPRSLTRIAACCLLGIGSISAQTTLVPSGTTWSWLRGTAEASNPTNAWRQQSFVESGWLTGAMPFWYGDILPGGTEVTGMLNVHTSLFFRKSFTISNPTEIGGIIINAKSDDGFVAWINGVEVARYNVTVPDPIYTSTAGTSVAEPPPYINHPTPDPRTFLVSGNNVLAVMGFNNTSGSSDFGLDVTMSTTGPDTSVPTITGINPPPGNLPALTAITVTFSEPLRGVTPDDLIINQTAAEDVSGSGNTWTFTFPQPPYGEVLIAWSPAHNVSDTNTPTHAFDETAPGTTWSYSLTDSIPPFVTGLNPPASATVNSLSQIEVTFSEPITGLNASDLIVNGAAATNVVGSAGNKYTFSFPSVPPGPVSVAWAGGHGIFDLAVPPNAFGGGNWNYTVDPNAVLIGVRINEFVAANANGLVDENGETQDWIELHNPTGAAVNLDGWSLTDDETYPDKWILPARTIAAGGYLVIFCSGKDRRGLTGNLHTNFKLSAPTGEYLALLNSESPRQLVSVFAPQYPDQRNDYSYGIDAQGVWRYYVTPTPNAANGTSTVSGVTAEVSFSVSRGFFDTPFQLHLASLTLGAVIRYTTDGSIPTATSSLYVAPISVTNTTCIRATAFAGNSLPSLVATHTYVFPGLVKNQSDAPAGFPTVWGTGGNQIAADYEVDPAVTNSPNYSATFASDLLAIPSMSIVMKLEDIFGTTGINSNPGGSGIAWERPASLELMYPNGRDGFQIDCGMRIQGGFGRSVSIKKHSFRPLFKSDYGASKLEFPLFEGSPVTEFDTFVLRAGMNNSYVLGTGEASRATFTEDEWMRQTQRAMGQVSGYGNFVHLYINGLYWGLYNATERPSAPFTAGHFGGEKEDWDALNSSEPVDGVKTAWTSLVNLCTSAGNVRYIVDQNEWNQVMAFLDVDNLIDYMLLNFYGGNQDWDDHNWYSARLRASGAGYKFFSWDGERTLETPTGQDRTGVNQSDKPSRIYAALRGSTNTTTAPLNAANVEFRVRFADHIQKHMFVNGPLTPAQALQRWNAVEAQVDRAVVGESARWGDKLREPPYTRNAEFLTEVNRKRNTQFPQRTAAVLTQLRTAKLFPPTNLVAPVFNQHGGKVSSGFSLTMATPTTGTIYYTLDGSDPRAPWTSTSSGGSAVDWSGSVATGAITYTGAFPLTGTARVKARTRETATGLWSPITEASFQVAELVIPIRITEVMYNPEGGDAYEFIELHNLGTIPVDLGLMTFEGVNFTFLRNTTIAPGARVVLASNVSPSQWTNRYPGVTPAGYFGGALSNSSEVIRLLDSTGNVVTSFRYADSGLWPEITDGGGRSLDLIDLDGDPS
ncbi:MAG TPA: lamin tail domain-containing protein, partial [Chthoniobacteraceae bacterium]|nr:lamin tail domain-containing protein [Chthoniobacteraceae bacterium]